MAITVEHGGQGTEGLGRMIAQAGQADLDRQQQADMQIRQLQAQRKAQLTDIEARADLQKQAADDAWKRTALQHGLEGQLKEQQFDDEMQKLQAAAKMDAQQFDHQYTTKQRQELARLNNARQTVANSPNYTEDERQAAFRAIDLQGAGIKPSAMPRNPNKPVFPDWANQFGVSVEPQSGVHGTFETRNGSPQFKPLPKELQPKWQEHDAKKAQSTAQQKIMEKRDEFESKLWTTKVPVFAKNEITGKSEKSGERMMNKEEVNAILEERFGKPEPPPAQAKASGAAQPDQQQQQQQPADWWGGLESQGIKVAEGERRLPQEVGTASALYRAYREKYGSYAKVPKELQPAFREAHNIIERYYGQRSSAQ